MKMKKKILFFLVFLLVGGLIGCEEKVSFPKNIPPKDEADTAGPKKDLVTIKIRKGYSVEFLEKALDIDLEKVKNSSKIYRTNVKEGGIRDLVERMVRKSLEKYIKLIEESVQAKSFEKTYSSSKIHPNDPLYPFQWNFDQVGVEKSWRLSKGENVTIAIVDTGVNYKEVPEKNVEPLQDLEDTSFVEGYDFIRDKEEVYDPSGHGTHVAGTVAQTTNNKYGVAGVAYKSTIMPVRVLDEMGRGTSDQIAQGIYFAAKNGADIINLSLGTTKSSKVMREAIKFAHNKGCTVVVSAGNGGKKRPTYPAAYKESIAVAATQYDKTTTFYSQKGDFIDVAAPGGNTKVDQNDDGKPDGILQETVESGDPEEHKFVLYMGTSMAAPHVSGSAAFLHSWGINHPKTVEKYLKSTAEIPTEDEDEPHKRTKEKYGEGIIQTGELLRFSSFRTSMFRVLSALFLGILLFSLAREERFLSASSKKTSAFLGSGIFVCSGLSPFFLALYESGISLPHWGKIFFLPPLEWDVILNPSFHQNPLFVSFLIPLSLILFFHGHKIMRYVSCGIATGIASFNLVEILFPTSDIILIPGIGLWDKLFLFFNSLVCIGIAYLSLTNRLFGEEKNNGCEKFGS